MVICREAEIVLDSSVAEKDQQIACSNFGSLSFFFFLSLGGLVTTKLVAFADGIKEAETDERIERIIPRKAGI